MIIIKVTDKGAVLSTHAEASANNWVGYESDIDWVTMPDHGQARATVVAKQLTDNHGCLYITCSPIPHRFDVIKAPAVGDEVSMGFNGDYYPCGKITSISKTLKVVTTDRGDKFYRQRNTDIWKRGTWHLVYGTVDRRNPEF